VDQDVIAARFATRVPAMGDTAVVVGGSNYVNTGIITSDDAWHSDPDGMTMHDLIGTNTNGDDAIGAALVDGNGTVTGLVVTADGLAVPLTYAERVIDELRTTRRVVHGWMGISGVDRGGNAVVTAVDPKSPAATAGLRKGDAIVAVDSRPILGMPELITAVRTLWPGDAVDVEVQRGSAAPVTVHVVVSGPPSPGSVRPPTGPTRHV
jgi:S1-C subfamily serine protease